MEVDEEAPALEVMTDNLSIKLVDPVPDIILNNPNPNYTIPEVVKAPDDILNVSNSDNIVPEVVTTHPLRGRPRGSFRGAFRGSSNTGTKGRENRTRTRSLAPFEKEGALTREDVRCIICVSIFIEPVVLPCKHCLCLECYRTSMSQATLCCPICRLRLSNWDRKNTTTLVNTAFWERIKAQFPEAVEARLQGQDSQSIPFLDSPGKPLVRDGCEAQEGEILHELEIIQKQHEQDLENEKRREAEASSEFIRQLQESEGPPPPPPQSPTQLLRDYELAKKLQEEEEQERQRIRDRVSSSSASRHLTRNVSNPSSSQSKPSSSSRSGSGSKSQASKKRGKSSTSSTTPTSTGFKRLCTTDLTGKQNKITNFFEPTTTAAPRCRSGTPDSINLEFSQHFQPIAPAPKTPPKRNSDGSVEESLFVTSRPVRRDLSIEFGLVSVTQTPERRGSEPEHPAGASIEVPRGLGEPGDQSLVDSRNERELMSGSVRDSVELNNTVGNSSAESGEDTKENQGEAQAQVQLGNDERHVPGLVRTVEYYLKNLPKLGSSDSIVMGSVEGESDTDRPREPDFGFENQATQRTSPFPSDLDNDSPNSSEYEFNMSIADRKEHERVLKLLKQEEEDRKYALQLQKELNKPVVVREKYELRKSDERRRVKYTEKDTSSTEGSSSVSSNQNQPSTSRSAARARSRRSNGAAKTSGSGIPVKTNTPVTPANTQEKSNDNPIRTEAPAEPQPQPPVVGQKYELRKADKSVSSNGNLPSTSRNGRATRRNAAVKTNDIPVKTNTPAKIPESSKSSPKRSEPPAEQPQLPEIQLSPRKSTRQRVRRKRFPSSSSSGSSSAPMVGSPKKSA